MSYENSFLKCNFSFIALFILLFTNFTSVFAQNSEVIELEWQKEKTLIQGDDKIIVPSIKNQHLDGNVPNFYWKKSLKSNIEYSIEFNLASTEPATNIEINYLQSQGIEVGEIRYDLAIAKSHEKRSAIINLFPFIVQQGQIKRIKSFSISIQQKSSSLKSNNKSFVANSVLQSGTWYKISANKDGIYIIDNLFWNQSELIHQH